MLFIGPRCTGNHSSKLFYDNVNNGNLNKERKRICGGDRMPDEYCNYYVELVSDGLPNT